MIEEKQLGGNEMPENRSESIIVNQMLNRRIVYAVNKAISDDIPQMIRENRLETNNRHIFASGDYINENLRKHVVKDEIELIPFKRYAWEGRILADRVNKITYTICTHQTLRTVIRKNRNRPHYLQSILYAENGDCQGTPKQITLGDFFPGMVPTQFEDEELNQDFEKIMQGSITKADGYKHYIVVYTAEHHEITEIEMLLLDKDFAEVDRISLMEYVNPDFASLTEMEYSVSESVGGDVKETRSLSLKLKPGVKPALRAMEENA